MATGSVTRSGFHRRFAGLHLVSDSGLRRIEDDIDARLRRDYESRRIRDLDAIERLRRDAEAMRSTVEVECRRLQAECRRSIREQYAVFDRQWAQREAYSGAKVEALKREWDEGVAELEANGVRGRKLLTLAVDPRTPEAEAVAAFLKARAVGIRIAE